eukprot:12163335-Alexandrium_andersonii.AAC.1
MDGNERRALRQALLGPAADAWASDGPEPQPTGRAVLLIDQGKAFEMLAPAWLEAVMAWRGWPEHWRRPVRAFVAPRWA